MEKMKQYMSLMLLLLCLFAESSLNAQQKVIETTINGTVYESATMKPLAGAQVVIPGVTSVLTAEDGTFTLKKTVQSARLIVSAPGFTTRQIALQGKSKLKIFLMDDSYTGVYRNIALPFEEKNALTSAYAASYHENIEDYKLGAPTIETVMQRDLGGINTVSRSGMPGSGANLYINGFNSLNASNQPLIIVDGIPFENPAIYSLITGNTVTPLSDFDIRDIDKITVMKDGASLYGSKGSNGVIIINTLRAKNPATRINFYSYAGINLESETRYRMMDGWSYKNYLTDMLLSKGMTTNDIQSLPYINTEKPVQENWGVSGNADYYRYTQNTDWQNEVLNSSLNQNYHLNITGGNDVILYAIGVGYLNHGGAVRNTDYSRYSFRTNASIKMTNWFKLNAHVSYVNSDKNLTYEGMNRNFSATYAGLIKSPFTAANVYNILGEETPNIEDADIFNVSNPLALTDYSSITNTRSRFTGVMNGELTFSKSLKADVIFGLTSDKVTKERIFLPGKGVFHTSLPGSDVTNESKQLRNNLKQFNLDTRLTYNLKFSAEQELNARLGFRFLASNSELDWGQAFNTSSDEMQTLGDGMNALAQIGGSLGNWKSVSNYLNVDYNYLNKYFVSLNAALDASSRFGADARGLKLMNQVFGFFPSVNAAWLLTSEDFMKNQTVFDLLKVRAGYSISGNDDIGNYTARHYYVPQVLLGAYGLVRGNVPNTELKWETNNKATLGIEGSILNEKLNFTLDFYSSTTKDLISITSNESYTGIASAVANDGSLSNSGFDLGISGRLIDKKGLSWDMGFNISKNRVKLLSMSQDETFTNIPGGVIRTKVGETPAQFWGYKTDGILNSTREANEAGLLMQNPDGSTVPFVAGDVKFVDTDGNKIINTEDMVVIGEAVPDFTGSLNTSVRWNSFTLSGFATFSLGGDVYNAVRASLESMTGTDNQTMVAANRWKYDGQLTSIPAAVWGDPHANSRFSDRWIEDGSYVRLKSVSLSYDLPLKSGFISSAQVYVTGNNLLTFSNYLGYDPEFSAGQSMMYYGIDRGVSPQPRTILLGVKIGL